MRKLILTLAALAAAPFTYVLAQDTQVSDSCSLYMSYYQDYYKQKTKAAKMEAIPSWRKAYDICTRCAPAKWQNLYVHGADLCRLMISQTKDYKHRVQLIDTLIRLDKQRIQYFPKYADKAYDALSRDVNNYLKNNPQLTYNLLNDVIAARGAKSTPVTFLAHMNAAVKLYGSKLIPADRVIEIYQNSQDCFEELQKTDTTANTRNIRATFENAFINSGVASCENLIALFSPRFDENSDDYDQVSKIVKLLAHVEGCTDNELFLKSVTAMHRLRPSGTSAYYLYRLHASQDHESQAIKYLEEACVSEDVELATKSDYEYELAVYCLKNGHYTKAVAAANKSIEIDASDAGKCYMVIGQTWMSVGGGTANEVDRVAKFWVAYDYFLKAKAADPSLASEAQEQASKCYAFFPEMSNAFMYDLTQGQAYHVTVPCGLSANTTARLK